MTPDSVLTAILAHLDGGADASDLTSSAFREVDPDLFNAALRQFGSWESTLAALVGLMHRLGESDRRRKSADAGDEGGVLVDDPTPTRVISNEARQPLFAITESGAVHVLGLDQLAMTNGAFAPLPPGPSGARIARLFAGGLDTLATVVTSEGNAVTIDRRLLPAWSADVDETPISSRIRALDDEERAQGAFRSRLFREAARVYSVSTGGQLKATDADEYRKLGSDPLCALLLRDDDALAGLFAGPVDATIFVASSAGYAIAFDAAEVRSQGRKATGVRAIQLDAGATVVGAYVAATSPWMALLTSHGFAKRMRTVEFRPQGRGGLGLQSCRLSSGDTVASVAPIALDGDVIVLTASGQYSRFPAHMLTYAARGARGEAFAELGGNDRIVTAVGVCAGSL